MISRNDVVNSFAHKYRCSRFDQQRMIEAVILELEQLKSRWERQNIDLELGQDFGNHNG